MRRVVYFLRALVLWWVYTFVRRKTLFLQDIQRWVTWKSVPYRSGYIQFVVLMSDYP